MPAKAKEDSAAGAVAFVRYWLNLLNYSGRTLDSDRLRKASSTRCVDCDAIADFIDKVKSHGGEIDGRGWQLLGTRDVHALNNRSFIIRGRVQVDAQRVVPRRGDKAQTFAGANRVKTFVVARSGPNWRLARLDQGVN
jgi:hypothetical protein